MNIIPWRNKRRDVPARFDEEFNPLQQLRSEFSRLVDRFFDETSDWGLRSGGNWAPLLDVSEQNGEVLVTAELPGVDPNQVDVSISGNLLILSGEKKESSERQEGNAFYSERRFGSFRRTVELPSNVDLDSVTAEHTGGILKIRMKKSAAANARKIPVTPTAH